MKPFYERLENNQCVNKSMTEEENDANLTSNTRKEKTNNTSIPTATRISSRTHRVPARYRD